LLIRILKKLKKKAFIKLYWCARMLFVFIKTWKKGSLKPFRKGLSIIEN
jgi:hypothetical protein